MKNKMAVVSMLVTGLWAASASAQAPKAAEKPAAVAAAAAPAPGQVPKPATENEIIKKSNGTWTCEGTAKGPDGQEMKYKSSWSIKPILGGHWFSVVYKRAKMGPMPAFEGNATLGYNVVEKKYTLIGSDNYGGWINLSSADNVVYAGDAGMVGHKSPAKFTFAPGKDKKGQPSDKAVDVTFEFGVATSTEACKK